MKFLNLFLSGKSHGQRNLVGYSPWGHKESDRTELLHFTSSQNIKLSGEFIEMEAFYQVLEIKLLPSISGTSLDTLLDWIIGTGHKICPELMR